MLRRVVLLAFLLACAGIWEPSEVVPLTPPSEYRDYWAKMERCSGRTGNFARVKWQVSFAGDAYSFPCPAYTGGCVGYWSHDHTITLAPVSATVESVVEHEILHELLNSGQHPQVPFQYPCNVLY